jgi:hypothetical protein
MLHIQHIVNLGMLTQMERIAKINGLDRLDKNIVQQHRQSLVIRQLRPKSPALCQLIAKKVCQTITKVSDFVTRFV